MRTAWLWNSSIVLQLNYEASWLCNSSAVKQPWGEAHFWFDSSPLISSTCSALQPPAPLCPALLCTHLFCSSLLCFTCFFLLWSGKTSSIFHLSCQRCAVFSLPLKRKVLPELEGAYLHRQKFPSLVPDWLILMQMRTPILSLRFDWSKKHCPDCSECCCSDWLVKTMMR